MVFILNNLCFRYASQADYVLNGLSLSVDSGLVTGLAGANGSGKTTLIRILLGQLIDIEGAYTIDGRSASDVHGEILHRYGIGYAPDDILLDEYLTGYEILKMIASLRKIPPLDFENDMHLFSENLRLDEWFYKRQCRTYSSGMRRKTALCLAYVGTPAFVVLDEPTNGLDPVSVYGLKKIIREKKFLGAGTLIASHILDFVEKTVDGCILLCNGRLSYQGPLAALKQAHDGAALEDIYFSLFSK
jgi:ABC-type multidrug transport system ATPase subunit